MNPKREVNIHYTIFLVMAFASLIIGFVLMPDLDRVREGLIAIIKHPSLLSTDYMVVGGSIGTSFVNASIITFMALGMFRAVGAKLQGLQVAGLLMVFGYGFYGKNPLNIIPLALGVLLEAKVTGKKLEDVVALACFAAALSPLVSVLAFGTPLMIDAPLSTTLPIAIVTGIVAGGFIGKFSGYVAKLHYGASLYNGALASGIVGILINFLLVSIGLGHDRLVDNVFIAGQNRLLAGIAIGFCVYFILVGVFLNRGFRGLQYFIPRAFVKMDFVYQFSMGKTLINMGLIGLVMIAYVLVIPKAQFNGPIYGALFTIIGFAAHGVTLPAMLPCVLGVFAGAFLTGGTAHYLIHGNFIAGALEKVATRDMLLAALFIGGFSPITKMISPAAGFFGGMLHSITVPQIAILHGWMVGYNNGVSIGLIAMLFFPLIETVGKNPYLGRILKRFAKEEDTQHVLKKHIHE